MTDEQASQLLKVLERIAIALEWQQRLNVVPNYVQAQDGKPCAHVRGTETTGGASCTKCGMWLGVNPASY